MNNEIETNKYNDFVFGKIEVSDELSLPYVIHEGKDWYPISYLSIKVLLRTNKDSLLVKSHRKKYPDNVKVKTVYFGESNIQETWCIDKELLIDKLKNIKLSRLTKENVVAQNKLHRVLGIDLLPLKIENDLHNTEIDYKNEEAYIQEIYEFELNYNKDMLIRQCSSCKRTLPLTNTFYPPHNGEKYRNGYNYSCKECIGKVNKFNNKELERLKDKKRLDEYLVDENILQIYQDVLDGEFKSIPVRVRSKGNYFRITDKLYDQGLINEHISFKALEDDHRLYLISNFISQKEFFSRYFDEDFYLYPWRFPNYKQNLNKYEIEIPRKIFNNYLAEKGIRINDIFTFDYAAHLRKARVETPYGGQSLRFVVDYYDKLFPGYYFKTTSPNYYKDKEYLLHDLKYFIEKDLKINEHKIPLYITKTALQRNCRPLYNYIVLNRNGSIYEYINELYPNKFTIHDFEINYYRDEFDSNEEAVIHEKLKESFGNVIYNQRNTDRSIEIAGSVPDWIIIDEKGLIIVEHLGMYLPHAYNTSSRIKVYIDKANKKLDKYRELKNFRFIFFYPDDIANNFAGIDATIRKFKENPDMTMI